MHKSFREQSSQWMLYAASRIPKTYTRHGRQISVDDDLDRAEKQQLRPLRNVAPHIIWVLSNDHPDILESNLQVVEALLVSATQL